MQDESMWIARAQSAEAQLTTLKEAYAPAIEKVKNFKANFGIKERFDGEIVIDFEKFVSNLGLQAAMELRKAIDDFYKVSGEPGKKPHIKLVS
jgi:aminopeptidase N